MYAVSCLFAVCFSSVLGVVNIMHVMLEGNQKVISPILNKINWIYNTTNPIYKQIL